MTVLGRTIVSLVEWQGCERPELTLTAEDCVLAERLWSDRRLRIERLHRGIRITSRSWVGVVRLTHFDIHVQPKLAGNNMRLVEMIQFTSGIDALRRYPVVRELAAEGGNLLDLLMLMLAQECERVLRAGLISDYVEEESELPVVRGRLLADRQLLKRFGRLDRVWCRHDEQKQNVLENQVLALVLDHCARRAMHPVVRRKARQLEHALLGVCDPTGLDWQAARKELFYNRLNDHYREAHQLAWLVLEALGIEDVFSAGSTRVFSFLLDMNRLFEAFVLKVVQKLLASTPLTVTYQHVGRSIIHAETRKVYARVIPDILIQGPSRGSNLVLDAKYKRYDTRGVPNADLYQAFLYAYAFGNAALPTRIACLIYPADSQAAQYEELLVRSGGSAPEAMVALIGLPIPLVLDELKAGEPGPATFALRSFLATIQL